MITIMMTVTIHKLTISLRKCSIFIIILMTQHSSHTNSQRTYIYVSYLLTEGQTARKKCYAMIWWYDIHWMHRYYKWYEYDGCVVVMLGYTQTKTNAPSSHKNVWHRYRTTSTINDSITSMTESMSNAMWCDEAKHSVRPSQEMILRRPISKILWWSKMGNGTKRRKAKLLYLGFVI